MRRDERGSTIPMIVILAAVLLLALVLVVNASTAFMQRQRLNTLADGAALYGADLGASGVYGEGLPAERLLQEKAAVERVVADYLRSVGAYERYPGLTVVASVDPAARTVTVTLGAPVDLPTKMPGTPLSPTVQASGTAAVNVME